MSAHFYDYVITQIDFLYTFGLFTTVFIFSLDFFSGVLHFGPLRPPRYTESLLGIAVVLDVGQNPSWNDQEWGAHCSAQDDLFLHSGLRRLKMFNNKLCKSRRRQVHLRPLRRGWWLGHWRPKQIVVALASWLCSRWLGWLRFPTWLLLQFGNDQEMQYFTGIDLII